MTPEKTALDDDAERLWIARWVAEPDAWRGRASNAAGLLSAAAAATLTGLLLHGDQLPPLARVLAGAAAVLYSLAVLFFLSASVHPSPPEDKAAVSYVDEVWRYCAEETKPIKERVQRGTLAGGAAIVATSCAAILVVAWPDPLHRGQVALTDAAPTAVDELCPNLSAEFPAEIERLDDGRVRLHLGPGVCGEGPEALELDRADVVMTQGDSVVASASETSPSLVIQLAGQDFSWHRAYISARDSVEAARAGVRIYDYPDRPAHYGGGVALLVRVLRATDQAKPLALAKVRGDCARQGADGRLALGISPFGDGAIDAALVIEAELGDAPVGLSRWVTGAATLDELRELIATWLLHVVDRRFPRSRADVEEVLADELPVGSEGIEITGTRRFRGVPQ